jgi:hypothetical protein
MVAEIIKRKPRTTEKTLDFADSFISALTGSTIIRPIQTIIPIAITLVTIWDLLIRVATIDRKSDHDSWMLRLISAFVCMPVSGKQFLKSLCIFPEKLQEAHDKHGREKNERRI